jgi:hypothetical protein
MRFCGGALAAQRHHARADSSKRGLGSRRDAVLRQKAGYRTTVFWWYGYGPAREHREATLGLDSSVESGAQLTVLIFSQGKTPPITAKIPAR